jgi:hypothetical protein
MNLEALAGRSRRGIFKSSRSVAIITASLFCSGIARADETFVTIQRVSGNQIAFVPDTGGAGRGMRGGDAAITPGQRGFGKGRRGGSAAEQPTIVTLPAGTVITSAMRERRTFEFRVGAELAGGLKHRVFQEMKTPLSARIVSDGNQITEINVLISETDINQSTATSSGEAIIAVRPKRPPMKRTSATGETK